MMNMMVKDVYRNFSAASEKVLVPKICVLDRGQLTDGGGGGGRGGGGANSPLLHKICHIFPTMCGNICLTLSNNILEKINISAFINIYMQDIC